MTIDEDYAYELRKQNKLDTLTDDEFVTLMNIRQILPDPQDLELRELEMNHEPQ